MSSFWRNYAAFAVASILSALFSELIDIIGWIQKLKSMIQQIQEQFPPHYHQTTDPSSH